MVVEPGGWCIGGRLERRDVGRGLPRPVVGRRKRRGCGGRGVGVDGRSCGRPTQGGSNTGIRGRWVVVDRGLIRGRHGWADTGVVRWLECMTRRLK